MEKNPSIFALFVFWGADFGSIFPHFLPLLYEFFLLKFPLKDAFAGGRGTIQLKVLAQAVAVLYN
jgi:hypothetical protein